MPTPGKRWWHITWNTHRTWLPGDPRGFRNRAHRIHSSGNYKNPPPRGEHAALHQFHRQRISSPILIPENLRHLIAETIAKTILESGHRILAVSVAAEHVHVVAELPVNLPTYREIIGDAKMRSSQAVTKSMPGKIWARGDNHRMKRDRQSLKNAYNYVKTKQGPSAAVWSFDGYSYNPVAPAPRRSEAAG